MTTATEIQTLTMTSDEPTEQELRLWAGYLMNRQMRWGGDSLGHERQAAIPMDDGAWGHVRRSYDMEIQARRMTSLELAWESIMDDLCDPIALRAGRHAAAVKRGDDFDAIRQYYHYAGQAHRARGKCTQLHSFAEAMLYDSFWGRHFGHIC